VRRLLGSAFGALASLRVAAYRRGLLPRARLAGPVVSVGNLGVGGSGKTPVVARVAALLRDAGVPVAVLSRGYALARTLPELRVIRDVDHLGPGQAIRVQVARGEMNCRVEEILTKKEKSVG